MNLWQYLILSIGLILCSAQDNAEGITADFTEEQIEKMSSAKPTEFKAEVNRLMEIIVNSLYRTRDIFLRELISNANDAIEQIRVKSLTDRSILGETTQLAIRVQADKDAGTLTILDTGCGMSASSLAENLGTIAHSGTAAFLDAMSKQAENPDSNLIGQFGVGFYSAFLVAEEVTVISKANDDDKQHIWRSKADGSYTIVEDPRGNTLGRGTAVILKIKEDAMNFLETDEIESIIQRYSQFIQYPIYLYSSRIETEDVDEDDSDKDKDDTDDGELSVDDEEKPGDKPKTIEKTVNFWKRLNENRPIWSRRPSQIKEEEYVNFYKSVLKDSDDPLSYTHFKAEGEIEFDSILYIPPRAPSGMYDQYYNSKSSLKLYVRRVLVADEFEDIIPRYLNFVKGLVDSNDLPLNVNREDIQKSKVMTLISRKLTRKILDMLKKIAMKDIEDEEDEDEDEDKEKKDDEDDDKKSDEEELEEPKDEEIESSLKKDSKYLKFWNEFGKSIKLGLLEDQRNRKRLLDLLRFPSSSSPDTPISLQSYVDRMKPGQKNIYYISGGSLEEVEASPFMERFKSRNWEVLYFIDNLDEYLQLNDYDDYQLKAITKEDTEIDGTKMSEFLKEKEKEFEDLKTWLKEIYGNRVSKVIISSTLTETPMAIGTTKYGYSAHMLKLTKSQAFGNQMGMSATKICQLNYRHPIIINLKQRIENGEGDSNDNTKLVDLANLLLDVALIQSGFDIESSDQNDLITRVSRIVSTGLEIPNDATLEPEPSFINDVDEDSDEEDDEEDEDDDDEEEEEPVNDQSEEIEDKEDL